LIYDRARPPDTKYKLSNYSNSSTEFSFVHTRARTAAPTGLSSPSPPPSPPPLSRTYLYSTEVLLLLLLLILVFLFLVTLATRHWNDNNIIYSHAHLYNNNNTSYILFKSFPYPPTANHPLAMCHCKTNRGIYYGLWRNTRFGRLDIQNIYLYIFFFRWSRIQRFMFILTAAFLPAECHFEFLHA